MKALDTNLPTALRKGAARVDQDGPWSVSVAETPYDAYSYSLYIKSKSVTYSLASQFVILLTWSHFTSFEPSANLNAFI